MADREIGRTIRFPQSLWDQLDRDAQRCKRSSVKQLEAVLSAYYQIANVELSTYVLKVEPGKYEIQGSEIGLTHATPEFDQAVGPKGSKGEMTPEPKAEPKAKRKTG